MPNVGSYELKGHDGSVWADPTYVKGHDGTSMKFGIAVYYHNGTDWVEVWNARPVATSTSMATTPTGLTFTGSTDPNNFLTTAKFEYKVVGGSYSNSGTTTTGMGDGVDGSVSFTVTATEGDTFKNWEARASASNAGGTGIGSTITLDCRKHNAGGSGWTETASYDASGCDSCGTKTLLTYTKSGCQTYNTGYSACSGSWSYVDPTYGPSTIVVGGVTYSSSLFGYTDYSSCGYCQIYAWDAYYCSVTGAYKVVNQQCYTLEFC